MTSTFAPSSTDPDRVVEEIYRADWGRLLSILIARTRRLDLAEDALSEAFARAAATWREGGVPDNPAGWLYTTANRQVVAKLRAEAIAGRKAPLLAVRDTEMFEDSTESAEDDRLDLILLCCHPALAEESQSALALRLVIGTSTSEIARLFLVSEATMAARLTRAKKKIVAAGIPLGLPVEFEYEERLDRVCRTVYLAFTAGYTPGEGADLLRTDLSGDAVRLAVILHDLLPGQTQVEALLALLLLQHSRREARVESGVLVPLPEQDRTAWNQKEIDRGLGLLSRIEPTSGYAEELRLQAMIASEHARADSAGATDWEAIATNYLKLEELTGSAIVRLNRAVAVAEVDGPEAGLALLHELDSLLSSNHRLHAVRGQLAHRAGEDDLARTSYELALSRCSNEVERSHIRSQLAVID